MKIKYPVPAGLCLTCLLIACKKEKPKPYSYWRAEGVEYTSNNNDALIDKRGTPIIRCNDIDDWFKLTFYTTYFPETGTIRLTRDNIERNPSNAVLSFYVNGKYYGIDNDITLIQANSVNGKARYILPPSWYSHYENGIKDSMLIEGTFNEP